MSDLKADIVEGQGFTLAAPEHARPVGCESAWSGDAPLTSHRGHPPTHWTTHRPKTNDPQPCARLHESG